MTGGDPDFLYHLLPEYLRFRDAGEGEPLRALFRVLEHEYDALAGNMEALYDDWFIETCADWVVPYLGDLVGVRGLEQPEGHRSNLRALVGNIIGNRRRKGVPAVLGQAAGEATGWPALAVPASACLATTQAMAHPQPRRGGTVSLRDTAALDRLGTPFDTLAHTASVTGGRARHNLPGIGLFLWRLESYPVESATAREVQAGCYTFHPFGLDAPLFNRPGTGLGETGAPADADFPSPLSRRRLADELARGRRAPASPFGRPPAFEIRVQRADGGWTPVLPAHLAAADLGDWRRPAPAAAGGSPPLSVAVDPERGRLALAAGAAAGTALQVSYCYGFSADLGGGPYERPRESPTAARTWVAHVAAHFPPPSTAAPPAGPPYRFPTLDEALASWPPAADAVIQILDSSTYDVGQAISLALAADPEQPRRLSIVAAQGARPCLRGDLRAAGPQPAAAGVDVRGAAELHLSGLWIDGQVVLSGEVNVLRIVHSTLRPGARPSVRLAAESPAAGAPPSALQVVVSRSIAGPLRLPSTVLALEVADSILDGGTGAAIDGYGDERLGPSAILARSTLFGEVRLLQLQSAEAVLFTAPVTVARPQQGEVRFSYVPAGSRTPRQTHCVAGRGGVQPIFTSTIYGAPGYAQLDPLTPPPLKTGSARGSEIGAFESLDQAQREVALRGAVADYLRWGMSTEIVDVT